MFYCDECGSYHIYWEINTETGQIICKICGNKQIVSD